MLEQGEFNLGTFQKSSFLKGCGFEYYFILFPSPFTQKDCSGRRANSCGTSGTGETPQAKLRRPGARPAESCAWSGNSLLLTQPQFLRKQPFKKKYYYADFSSPPPH
ncbi:hypothetical protein FZC79_07060 [Rossellomorea vietnamensis]|uniref:Uncharacterized protein n=1 Tax=Rossellomorea vietnamensis TaxID=218284 RepID=A0A5D4KIE1_9BACI|nr:hypothetical protein FZC79_07060 [Rossellomorea vietnamensis]